MSHYAVAVFADSMYDFEMLLEPYNENSNEQRFVYSEEELRKRFEEFLIRNPSWKNKFEDYLEEFGYKREGNEIAKYYNPNAKWDWYVLDGKEYLFNLKPDAVPDPFEGYRKNDYDYSCEDGCAEDSAKFWDDYVVNGVEPEDHFMLPSREHYLKRYKTKEQYVKEAMFSGPYAFVTPDGVWHAPGNIGYFAEDDATCDSMNVYMAEWNSWIADTEHNPYVSFVDCHI